MAVKIGKVVKVTCGTANGIGTNPSGTYVVAEMGTYTLSGFTRDALDSTAFGDDIKEFTFGVGDGGTISFSGNYDPTDASGQMYLRSHCSNGSTMLVRQIRWYIDSTSYLTPDTGGFFLITKVDAVSFEKAGIGTIQFEGKLSGSGVVVV